MSTALFTSIDTYFSIYFGLPVFIFGFVGNIINICILFSTRSNSSSFLLLISSIFNLITLCFGLFARVLTLGFGVDPSPTNVIWCKSRLFLSYVGTLMALTTICFASIDRFLLTCRNVQWRKRSQLSTAKLAISIAILVVIGHNISYLIFYTIVEVKTTTGNISTKCSVMTSGFVLYANYFVRPVLLGVLPGTILIISGFLTYRNITSIAAVQLRGTFQRSLTKMILLQIIIIIIPITPSAIFNIYQNITSSVVKTSYRLALETLVSDMTNIFLYVSYACNFYVYIISSSCYRQDFLRFICCSNENHLNNRVGTVTKERIEMNTGSTMRQLPRSTNQMQN
ncbi:unnamed protein product [Adineta steineri]|uniref:G-protein coupled receptors family 1 profile domain-containing protein n=1 Tax=Adineta steineri TaxID=433720 RepID=A0A814AVQ3_9BILA|nr:unnamed protein product [Adineta steineri]CAF0917430.1 unnamed protein product [Adineta steineri]CAF3858742.1 unnamed protein product [Adineta steineri]